MATPSDLTILNITGKYMMNKSLSDPRIDNILVLQGVSWPTRMAIKYGNITLAVKHYKDDSAIEHVDIDQTITGGFPGTRETRELTWEEGETNDRIFGHVLGKSRRVPVDQLDVAFLKEGWTADTINHGLIQSYVKSDTAKSGISWIANQTWGIEKIKDERRYVRHVKFTGPKGQDIEARLIYDYLGPL